MFIMIGEEFDFLFLLKKKKTKQYLRIYFFHIIRFLSFNYTKNNFFLFRNIEDFF